MLRRVIHRWERRLEIALLLLAALLALAVGWLTHWKIGLAAGVVLFFVFDGPNLLIDLALHRFHDRVGEQVEEADRQRHHESTRNNPTVR